MLRRIFMLYRMCISCPNLPSRDTLWNSGPAGQCFRVPPRAFPRIRVRGITGVTLTRKSCCLRCSASTCCPHLVLTVTGEDRRLGCGPVTHLVRGGPSSGLAGLGRTGLSGSSLPVRPGPAILHALSPLRRLGRSGTHWRGPPPWAPAADGSPERLPQRHGTRSLSSLRDASASNGLASDCRRQPPWQPAADSSEPAPLRAEVTQLPPARCRPYLPRLRVGLRIVSRASVPQGSVSTPTHAVCAPAAPTISLSFAPFGQYPVAHRPSVPRWLAGGSRAVSTPACVAGPSLVRPPPRASASNVQASEPQASESARRPSPSAGTRVPSSGCPASPATGRLHYQPGPRPGRAPSTAPPGPPEADPDPGPRLRHRGASSTGQQDWCR